MIHLDFADGTSAWLTDEQLKEQHPELYAKLRHFAGLAIGLFWRDTNGEAFSAGYVTHWMPFPEPPSC